MLQTGLNLLTSNSGISIIANVKNPDNNEVSFHFNTYRVFCVSDAINSKDFGFLK